MKEEVVRIMRLVQEGKLSPEDAAELIDAFETSEPREPGPEPKAESGPQPPPPPPGSTPPPPPQDAREARDPFRSFVDTMENLGKEITQNVNWHEVARNIREGAQKAVDELKLGVNELKQGKVNFGWFSAYENREVSLPLGDVSHKTLRVENPCGDIKISGGFETNSVTANARIRGSDAADAHARADQYTVIVEESDHEIVIRQPDVSALEVDLVVQLGRAAHLDVKNSNGDIDLLDTGGGCRVSNSSGDIKMRGLSGAIEISTMNGDIKVLESETPSLKVENKTGDITLEKVSGNVNARSASGDVALRNCSGKSISVESVNGDVKISLVDDVSGNVSVRTVNGDAVLQISEASNCRVSLSTLRGEAQSAIILLDEAMMEQRITGRLGDGVGSVDVSAVNGDVTLARLEELG